MDAALALAPVALAALVWRHRKVLPDGTLWLAAALAISTVGDLWSTAIGGAWYPSYVWLPVQLALAIRAVSADREWVGFWVWLAVLGAYDVLAMSGPDVVVTGVGSTVVVWMAMRSGHRLTVPVLVYFGLGSVAYLGMVAAIGSPWFMGWWWAYQGCRVLGWLALAAVVRCCWWRHRQAVRAENGTHIHMMEVAT